jgi:hypothetical protein
MKKNKKIYISDNKIESTMNELFEDNGNYILNNNKLNINDELNNNNEINNNDELNNKNNKYKTCDTCQFKTLSTSALIKHLETNKHKNKINPVSTKCNKCDYEAKNKWNLNLHLKSQHINKDDKDTLEYYCKLCDTIFFCEKYLLKHNIGKKHNNNVKLNQLIINNNIDNFCVNNNLINN